MAVRNFWIETTADGVSTVQTTGPRAKDDGFRTTVKVRENGKSVNALSVEGYALEDGSLVLSVLANGQLVHTHRVER